MTITQARPAANSSQRSVLTFLAHGVPPAEAAPHGAAPRNVSSSAAPFQGAVRPAEAWRAACTVAASTAALALPHWLRMCVSSAAISASLICSPKAGISAIALTRPDSPVALAAEITIAVDLPESDNIFRPTSTRYAYLAVIDMLANLVAYADRPKSLKTLRGIKEELVSRRDGVRDG